MVTKIESLYPLIMTSSETEKVPDLYVQHPYAIMGMTSEHVAAPVGGPAGVETKVETLESKVDSPAKKLFREICANPKLAGAASISGNMIFLKVGFDYVIRIESNEQEITFILMFRNGTVCLEDWEIESKISYEHRGHHIVGICEKVNRIKEKLPQIIMMNRLDCFEDMMRSIQYNLRVVADNTSRVSRR